MVDCYIYFILYFTLTTALKTSHTFFVGVGGGCGLINHTEFFSYVSVV